MKRAVILFVFTIILTLMLTSCDIHHGNIHHDVHWWVIAIPVVIILVIAHISFIAKRYRCPMCGTEFRPKWYEISSWLHDDNGRAVKCPHCGRRGFCPPADD